jgi:hypothetical protein
MSTTIVKNPHVRVEQVATQQAARDRMRVIRDLGLRVYCVDRGQGVIKLFIWPGPTATLDRLSR